MHEVVFDASGQIAQARFKGVLVVRGTRIQILHDVYEVEAIARTGKIALLAEDPRRSFSITPHMLLHLIEDRHAKWLAD